jgi:hypothetical protein
MQPVENQDRKKTENKDIGVEPSRGQPTVNPWYSETRWKIGQEKKKRKFNQLLSQPRPPQNRSGNTSSEIPQQQNPHNVLPTRPYTEIFAHVAPKKIENTNVVKQTPPPFPPKSRSICRYSFFFW